MNLIICTTPFQVLVAERIIELNHPEPFVAVMISSVDNDKYQYYKKRLFDKSTSCCDFVKKNNNKLLEFLYWAKIRLAGLRYKNINKVYIASIDSIKIQLFLSSVDYRELYTFDDGTANIIKNSMFYCPVKQKKTIKYASKILGNKFHNKDLKDNVIKHYSVYKGRSNIVDDVEHISLINDFNFNSDEVDETISLFLGQPIYELCGAFSCEEKTMKNILLAKKVVEKYKIDYYFPHPRENYTIDGVSYINSELIFEDYFSQNFRGKNCIIYTFFSGAALSLLHLNNVTVISLKPKDCPREIADNYKLIEEFKISILDI